MAAGIDVAGLALAVFPIVIGMVDRYSGLVTGRDINFLADSLRNNEQMFLNSIELLLQSTVPPAELRVLLDDFDGDPWKSKSLNERVTENLGQQAESILEKINDIYKTVLGLKLKLPARTNDTTDNDKGPIIARAKLVIKCFVHGPHYKASLDRLKIRISEFRTLTTDALKLASSRKGLPKALQDLDLVQECASGLHDALQAGLKCECDQFHPANIQLEVWSLRAEGKSDKVRLKFSFLFADDAQHAQHEHWMTAEITPSRTSSSDGVRPLVLGSLGGSLGDLFPNLVSSQTGTSALAQAVSRSDSSVTSAIAQDNEDSVDDVTDDLCAILKSPEEPPCPVRRRLGSISDSSGHSYHLFSKPDPSTTKTSVKLAEFFSRRRRVLSNRDRVQLALNLAWGVLQISSTSWLKGKWTKDNILLVMDAPNKPLPYISHRFRSSRQNPRTSTLAPITSNQIADWISNASLFALGVFLLEMCYNRSIEDLATGEEKNERGEPWPYTPFLTAMRLSKVVQEELGVHYAQAVNACLHFRGVDMDAEGRPKDSSRFAKSIIRDIIDPLKTVADTFGQ